MDFLSRLLRKSPAKDMFSSLREQDPAAQNAAAGQATHADPVLTNESPTTPSNISVACLQSKNSKISDVKTNQKEPVFLTPFDDSVKTEYKNTPTNDIWQEDNFGAVNRLDLSETITVLQEDAPLHRKKIFNVLTESFETPVSSIIGDPNLTTARDNCEIGQDPLNALVYGQDSSNNSTLTDININQASNVSVEEVSAVVVPVDVTSSISTDAVPVLNKVNTEVCDDILTENIENVNYDFTQDEGIAIVTPNEQDNKLKTCKLDIDKLSEDSLNCNILDTSDREEEIVNKLLNVSFEKNINCEHGIAKNELPQQSYSHTISNDLNENCHNFSYDIEISKNIIEHMKEISAVKNTINSLLEGTNNLNNSLSFSDNGNIDSHSLYDDIDIPQSEGIAIIEDENFGPSVLDKESDSLTTLNQCIDKLIENSQSEEENCDIIERLENQIFENIEKSCNNHEEFKSDSQVNDEAALEILLSQIIKNTNESEVIHKNDDSINLISDIKSFNSNQSNNSSIGLIDSAVISEIENIASDKCLDNVSEPMECDDYVLPSQENGINIEQYVPTVSSVESFVNVSQPPELNTSPFEARIEIAKIPEFASTQSNSIHLNNFKALEGNGNLDEKDEIKLDDSEPMECDVSFNIESYAISDASEKSQNITQVIEGNKLTDDIHFKTGAKIINPEHGNSASKTLSDFSVVTLSESEDKSFTPIYSPVSKSEGNVTTSDIAESAQIIEINKSLEEVVENKSMVFKTPEQFNSVSQDVGDLSAAILTDSKVENLPLAEQVIATKSEGDIISDITEKTQIIEINKSFEEDNCFTTKSKILNSPEQIESTSQKVCNFSVAVSGSKDDCSNLVEKGINDNFDFDKQLEDVIDTQNSDSNFSDVSSVNTIWNPVPGVQVNKIPDEYPLTEEISNVSKEKSVERTVEAPLSEKNESYTDKSSSTLAENKFKAEKALQEASDILENIHDTDIPIVHRSNDIENTSEKVLTPHDNNIASSESDRSYSLNLSSSRSTSEIQGSTSSENIVNDVNSNYTEVMLDNTFAIKDTSETLDDDNLVLDIESDILSTDFDGLESTDSDAVSVCSSINPSDFNPFETRSKISNTPERDIDTTLTLDNSVSDFESTLDATLVKQNKTRDNFKNPIKIMSNHISESLPNISKQNQDTVSRLMSNSSTDDYCNANLTSFNMSIACGDFVKNSASFKHNLERMNDVIPDHNENTPKSANIIRSEISKQSASAHTLASPMGRDRRLNHLTKKTTRLSPMSRCGDLMGMSPVSHEDGGRDNNSPTVRTNDLLTGDRFAYSNIIDDLKEEFKMPGELFKDPAAFDYLLSCGTGGGRDLCKESLLVKFDPLVGTRGALPTGPRPGRQQADLSPPKLEEDASTASGLVESCSSDSSLCTSNSEQAKILGTMSSVEQSLGALSLQSQGVQQHSAANCSTPPQGISTSIVNVTTQPTEKPTQVVTPAISTRQQYLPSTPLSSKNAPTPAKSVSSALAAIDRLISLGGSPPPPPVVVQPKEPDMDPRLVAELQSVRELLSRQEEELRQSEERSADIQKQLKDAIAREHALIDRVNEKNRDHRQMDMVMEEYERTMSQFIGERETEKRQWGEERAALMRERDEANSHLANMEHSFNDIHAKYERCKAMVQGYKTNEEVLKETVRLNEEASKKQLERYEQFRQHAMSQLEIANQEIDTVKRSSQSEVIKLQAMLKKSDIQIASLQESLSQKVKDIEDLTAICDDLIQKVA